MAQSALTFDDVIEEHRQAVGASKVNITRGPNATPEGVAGELREIRRRGALYESFTELEKEQAKVNRHRVSLRKIGQHCKSRIDQELTVEELNERLSVIFQFTDLIADVSIELDLVFMVLRRRKLGQVLPQACAEEGELIHELVAKHKDDVQSRFI
jgi:hypothetical protein